MICKLDGFGNNLILSVEDEIEFIIEGMFIFFDLLKESVGKVIVVLWDNGVVIKVFIGDNLVVMVCICLEVGIDMYDILIGIQVEVMLDVELVFEVEKCVVFVWLMLL